MKYVTFLIGLCLGLVLVLMPLSQFQPSSLEPWQTLAVQLEGRKKPLDTIALETIAKIHGSSHYQPLNDSPLDYRQTYLSLWFNDRDWNQEPFVLVSYRPLKEKMGLDITSKYFSFQDLMQSPELTEIVLSAHQAQTDNQDLSRDQREALTIEDRLALMLATVGNNGLPIVPHPSDPKGQWLTLDKAQQYYTPAQAESLMQSMTAMQQAYQHQNNRLAAVGEAAARLQNQLRQLSPTVYPTLNTLRREVHYQTFHPFAQTSILYGFAFVVMLLALWLKPIDLYWGAIGLFVAGIGVQSYGFWLRMQIAGRPPVTNMYESVVWVGFGIAALALLFELTSRARYYLLAAAPLSILCLVTADRLPAVLDASIQPLVPVLRDNFWLSVHVPTITLSYASFALALGLGHVALGYYLFAPQSHQRIQALSQFNYRVLQVGVLLLTTGIILGGIWAHVSWGRFWGWDPKETWAFIALLCYLVPLHGRLIGWLGNFGLNVVSVVAFNAVLMAWYGVNFVLGTGLHSYGFGTGGSEIVVISWVGLELLLVAVTTIRYRRDRADRSDAQGSPNSLSEPTIVQDILNIG